MNLKGRSPVDLVAADDIPLGHKIALKPVAKGERVVKYGVPVGRATEAIKPGQHVHVHNLRSLRWAGAKRQEGVAS